MIVFCVCAGPSELDNFTDEMRGVIPRSFEYLFFLINREVERVRRVSLNIQDKCNIALIATSCCFFERERERDGVCV